ncbi:hypothetical protein BGZ49_004100, partial [Haplosporangium sp. Z 27]
DVDHEALKQDLGIPSFGQRSKILAKVRMLREKTDKSIKQEPDSVALPESPLPATVMNLMGLGIGLGGHPNITQINSKPHEYCSDEEVKAIPLLEKPLYIWKLGDIAVQERIGKWTAPDDIDHRGRKQHNEDQYSTIDDANYPVDVDDEPLVSRMIKKKGSSFTSTSQTFSRKENLNGSTHDPSFTGSSISERVSPPSGYQSDRGIDTPKTSNTTKTVGLRRIAPTLVSTLQPPTLKDLEPAYQSTSSSNSPSPAISRSQSSRITSLKTKKKPYLTRLSLRYIFNLDDVSVDSDTEDEWFQKSTWDTMFKNKDNTSSSVRLDLNSQEHDMTSIDFRAITGKAPYKATAHTQADDPIYPLYGDSDASAYTTDEELHKEVAKEEKEKERRKSTHNAASATRTFVPLDNVRELTTKYMLERKERWEGSSKPSLEKQRFKLYKELMHGNNDIDPIDRIVTEHTQLEARLKSFILAIWETQYKNEKEVRRACQAVDRTLDQVYDYQWKLDLLRGSPPLPPSPSSPHAEHGQLNSSNVISTSLDQINLKPKKSISHSSAQPRRHSEGDSNSTSDEEEERRQRELDAAFIDDSDFDFDHELSNDDDLAELDEVMTESDEDIVMKELPLSKQQTQGILQDKTDNSGGLGSTTSISMTHWKQNKKQKKQIKKQNKKLKKISRAKAKERHKNINNGHIQNSDSHEISRISMPLDTGESSHMPTKPNNRHGVQVTGISWTSRVAPPVIIDLDHHESLKQESVTKMQLSPEIENVSTKGSTSDKSTDFPLSSAGRKRVSNLDGMGSSSVNPGSKRGRTDTEGELVVLNSEIQLSSTSPEPNLEYESQDEHVVQETEKPSLAAIHSSESDSVPPSPTTRTLEMRIPDWRNILKDDEFIVKEFRSIRKELCRG